MKQEGQKPVLKFIKILVFTEPYKVTSGNKESKKKIAKITQSCLAIDLCRGGGSLLLLV
jgi:hypothetical protein